MLVGGMSQGSSVAEREDPPGRALASDIVTAAKAALAAFGELPGSRRNLLVARLAPGVAHRRRGGLPANEAARVELDALVERWLAAVFGGRAPDLAGFQAAFLEIDAARRWPEQLLSPQPSAQFRRAILEALPRPLPPEAPLEMPDQALD